MSVSALSTKLPIVRKSTSALDFLSTEISEKNVSQKKVSELNRLNVVI